MEKKTGAVLKKGTIGLTVLFVFVQTSAPFEFREPEKNFRRAKRY
jgi:hypothetical protein